jgi:hypothetical protein
VYAEFADDLQVFQDYFEDFWMHDARELSWKVVILLAFFYE